MAFIIVYIILAAICGLLGNRTRIGFWGVFLLSFFFTPITTLIYLFFLKTPSEREMRD